MALGKMPGGDDLSEDEGIFAEINITPLTDIFLVLLIIFMVTSSVMADAGARSGMRVNLPKGAVKEVSPGAEDITIAVMADGQIMMKGKPVDVATLERVFKDAAAKNNDTQVIVQADEVTHHGRVVAVMELARTTGLRRLAIATRRGK
jgi:biopolymer transport protein ExbD